MSEQHTLAITMQGGRRLLLVPRVQSSALTQHPTMKTQMAGSLSRHQVKVYLDVIPKNLYHPAFSLFLS